MRSKGMLRQLLQTLAANLWDYSACGGEILVHFQIFEEILTQFSNPNPFRHRMEQPATMMCLVWSAIWIIWWHCCCWNYTIAINFHRPLHKPHHHHHASNICWAKICSTNCMNGVKQQNGNGSTSTWFFPWKLLNFSSFDSPIDTRMPFGWSSWSYMNN